LMVWRTDPAAGECASGMPRVKHVVAMQRS
jgi:hypothetical protein